MNYNSVAEIFDDIDATRARLVRSVESLSDAEQSFRPAPEKWSAAEIVEHLSIIERRVTKLVARLLDKAEAQGRPLGDGEPFAPVSVAEFVERSRTQKFDAPEEVRPAGVPLADSLDSLRESRAALRALRPRVARVDGRAVRFPHPAWGPLDLYQWVAFVGAHEARHLAQIEALKETLKSNR
jgi:hypothetical protein